VFWKKANELCVRHLNRDGGSSKETLCVRHLNRDGGSSKETFNGKEKDSQHSSDLIVEPPCRFSDFQVEEQGEPEAVGKSLDLVMPTKLVRVAIVP
jgi:hypothetical protein